MSSSPTTSTSTTQASNTFLPYQEQAVADAANQYNSVTSPSQLVAPLSSQQNQAITGVTNLATNGSSEENAANNYVTSVLSGSPANNPYLSSEFQLGANSVQNQLESEFAGSGSNVLNSLPVQSDELNNLATQLYGGAYNTGVQQEESASSLAPTLDSEQYSDLGQLNSAGQEVQTQAQNLITAPQNFLSLYANLANQPSSSTQVSTSPLSTTQQIGADAQTGQLLSNLLLGSSSNGTVNSGLLSALSNYL